MKIQLPEKVKYILDILIDAGFDAYTVGGCVRDSLLNKEPMDWDITTSARPEEVKELFLRTVDTGIEHGTVTVMIGKEGFEVTTYRVDGEYEDARHPKEVIYTPELKEDLKRRDFTINAMAYNDRVGLVDEFHGMADLELGRIRCVGDPFERFQEDALRMMRAVRFAAQLGFWIEDQTRDAIKVLAPTLDKISAERIQTELVKLLISDHPDEILALYETGITAVVFPEFDKMMQTDQKNPHHRYSVGEHTILSLTKIQPLKVYRLTMLLHDIAKPDCVMTDANGIDHYPGHQQMGSEMAVRILRRLKFDNDTIHKVQKLILVHDENPKLTESAVRKAIVSVGPEFYPSIFHVKQADILAQSDYYREKKLKYLADYEKLYDKIIGEQQCLSMKELAVSGKDLIAEGMNPGKELGDTLHFLFEKVIEDPRLNQKEHLLKLFHAQHMK